MNGLPEEFDETAIRFLDEMPVARLATADGTGAPQVIPVCFARSGTRLYITIDQKPKRATGKELKRVRNIRANPHVSLVADRYTDDWRRLGWVMISGTAQIIESGAEHDSAQALLRRHYHQYREMDLDALPVIAIQIERLTSWGDLSL